MRFFTHPSSLIPRYFDVVFLILLAAYILLGVPIVPYHGDESTLIYMSRDYAYQFLQGDLDLVRYQDAPPLPEQQYLRLINGSIPKYTIGMAWHLAGFTVDDTNEQWDWGADWQYNETTGRNPGAELLVASRYPSAIFTALGVVAVFALGYVTGGHPAAYLASLYCALNPAILLNGRRAMMEGSPLLFTLLTVLAGIWFLRRPAWWTALLLGAASGLALASKHTSLFTIGAVFAACILYPVIERGRAGRETRDGGTRLALLLRDVRRFTPFIIFAAFIAALVFYALNPVWWGANALNQLALMLNLRNNLLNTQVQVFGGYDGRLDQLAGFLRQTFVAQPMYYEVANWGGWIADQIARYEASPLRGVSIGGSAAGGALVFALMLYGAWTFVRSRAIALPVRWVVGLWALAMLLTTWVLTPLEWQRYYLPAYPVVGLFAALGLVRLAQAVWSARSRAAASEVRSVVR